MKRVIKKKGDCSVLSSGQNRYETGYRPVGYWLVKSGVNHPLAFRQLLVRYFLAVCLLLALIVTVFFYVRRGRHLHVSSQAEVPYILTQQYVSFQG